MLEAKTHAPVETLLVYLPCHSDFRLAIDQANRIREIEKAFLLDLNLKIMIMISCNGVELSEVDKSEIAEITDALCLFPFGISPDVNITQGFMYAIKLKVDYLWILSANDKVSERFIHTINECLIKNTEANILLGCSTDKPVLRKIKSVFDKENHSLPLGLISSVVYRTEGMANNFDSAVQMNWTGWGQLAAIEASCKALHGINVSMIDESGLHQRSIRTFENLNEEMTRVRNVYAHSFFGMPIIISSLHTGDPHKRRRYLNDWIAGNWYLVKYFTDTKSQSLNLHVASNQIWLRELSFGALRNASLRYRVILFLSMRINFNSLAKVKIAQVIRKKIKVR